jgi:hypothetical protein
MLSKLAGLRTDEPYVNQGKSEFLLSYRKVTFSSDIGLIFSDDNNINIMEPSIRKSGCMPKVDLRYINPALK